MYFGCGGVGSRAATSRTLQSAKPRSKCKKIVTRVIELPLRRSSASCISESDTDLSRPDDEDDDDDDELEPLLTR